VARQSIQGKGENSGSATNQKSKGEKRKGTIQIQDAAAILSLFPQKVEKAAIHSPPGWSGLLSLRVRKGGRAQTEGKRQQKSRGERGSKTKKEEKNKMRRKIILQGGGGGGSKRHLLFFPSSAAFR